VAYPPREPPAEQIALRLVTVPSTLIQFQIAVGFDPLDTTDMPRSGN